MANLPFKNAGKAEIVELSDPTLGTLEFPKRYSITLNEELDAIRILSAGNERSVSILELEGEIKSLNAQVEQALNDGNADDSRKLSARLAELKITHERRSLESQYETTMGLATLAIRRIQPDWSEEQTKELPRPLTVAIAEYLLSERNGWKVPDPVALGKLLIGEGTKNRSKKATAKSTGDSIEPSPETPVGTTTDSPNS